MEKLEVLAHVAGRVIALETCAGQRVAEEDPLLFIEVMKMETPVEAPAGGLVCELLVAVGDTVREGQAVARLEVP